MPDGTLIGRLRPHPHQDHDLQARLAHWNRARLAPQTPQPDWRNALVREHEMRLIELDFIESTRAIHSERARTAPREPQVVRRVVRSAER